MRTTTPRLPGEELLHAGLADLRRGRQTEATLVVQIAAPRLRALGYDIPEDRGGESPEHRLYSLLARESAAEAHSRYNALLARIASFASAAEHASPR